MKALMEAKAILHDDGQLEVKVTPFAFDERQTRQLASAMVDLIMGMLGDDMPADRARLPDHFKFTAH